MMNSDRDTFGKSHWCERGRAARATATLAFQEAGIENDGEMSFDPFSKWYKETHMTCVQVGQNNSSRTMMTTPTLLTTPRTNHW